DHDLRRVFHGTILALHERMERVVSAWDRNDARPCASLALHPELGDANPPDVFAVSLAARVQPITRLPVVAAAPLQPVADVCRVERRIPPVPHHHHLDTHKPPARTPH